MQVLNINAGVNADADAWASAIALWEQGPAELKTHTQSGAIPVMTLYYLIWKPLVPKSTVVFYFSAVGMYMYKSMILY